MGTVEKRAVDLRGAAEYLSASPRTVGDKRWRRRHKLPATRVGKRLVFLIRDLDALLARGREQFPRPGGEPEGED